MKAVSSSPPENQLTSKSARRLQWKIRVGKSQTRRERRLEAVKALQAKAELYGRATGYKAVRLVNLSEGGGYTPPVPQMPMFAMAKREMADSTSISAGELKVRVDVSAVYEAAK